MTFDNNNDVVEDIHVPLSMSLVVGDESIGIIGQWDHLSRPT